LLSSKGKGGGKRGEPCFSFQEKKEEEGKERKGGGVAYLDE